MRFKLLLLFLFGFIYLNAQQTDGMIKSIPSNVIENTNNKWLDDIFLNYTIFNLDANSIYRNLQNSERSDVFQLGIGDDINWTFSLEQVEILTDQSKIYTLDQNGREVYRKKPKVNTYKGRFSDGSSGSIRLTVSNNFFYALIKTGDTEYFIEPLRYFDKSKDGSSFVVYQSNHIKDSHASFTCDKSDFIHENETQESQVGNRSAGDCYKMKMALMADYSMFIDAAHPGIDAVIDHMVGVMNNVQSNYIYNGSTNFNDGLTIEISEIVISTCQTCDPLSGQPNALLLLPEFSSWVDQGGFFHPFNAAHFWTDRDFIGTTVGLAFQASNLLCTTRARAILQDWTTTGSLLKTMVAHELGHNLNGVHDSGSGFILSPTLLATNTWSTTSKTAVSTQIANQGISCLASCTPIDCVGLENVQITNINNNSFTVSWSASTMSLYTIKVREKGAQNFISDVTTINTSIVMSPPGYAICKEYDVFIYNNCGSYGLSAPQRIFIKAPTSQGCADFTVSKSVGWNGTTIQFTDQSINATSWLWNFGNGVTSTLRNPSFTYSGNAAYNVSLKVNNVHTMLVNSAVTILPDMTAPFTLAQGGNFESNPNYFTSEVYEGSLNLWERGTSTYVLSTMGGNAWKTRLNSDILQVTSKSALYTPRFDLTQFANYTLHFDIGMETQFCNAPVGAQMQYSLDNGITWTRLGSSPSFYNAGPGEFCELATQVFTDKTGWTINSNYSHKSLDLSFLSGQSSVIFRMVASVSGVFNGGYEVDGVLFDNIRIDAANPLNLPLNVSSLQAWKQNKEAHLMWEVYLGNDIQEFILERSSDGINFSEIGILKLWDHNQKKYNYNDQFPLARNNYYRIKAIYFSGKSEYTNIVILDFSQNGEIVFYPNPLHEDHVLNIVWKDRKEDVMSIKLFDMVGKVQGFIKFPPFEDRYMIDIQAGNYILQTRMKDGSIFNTKLVSY